MIAWTPNQEIERDQYLLPVDYEPPADDDDRESDKAICLNNGLLAEHNKLDCRHLDSLHMVMLDCCRDDPTNTTFRGTRRGGKGVAQAECLDHRRSSAASVVPIPS